MAREMHRGRRRWPGLGFGLACLVLLGIVIGCQTVAQVSGSGWSVWRYDTFNVVWASISQLLNLDRLNDSTPKTVMNNGYVAVSPSGQGCLSRKPGCTLIWVWQGGSWSFGAETLSACAKGSTSVGCSASSTTTVKDCAVTIITKPATISVKSIVTVADDQDVGLTLVIVHRGEASIRPARAPGSEVPVGTGQAAYFASPEMTPERLDALVQGIGFPPEQPVSLDRIVSFVEAMGWTPQIRRANAVVVGEGEIVPLPIPFAWSLRSMEDPLPWDGADQLAMAWRSAAKWEEVKEAPLVYAAWPDKEIAFIRQLAGPDLAALGDVDYSDLREIPAGTGGGPLLDALGKRGYDPAKEIVLLVAEESNELLGGIADWIAGQLKAWGVAVIIKMANSEALTGVASEWQAAGHAVFILTWY